MRAQATNGTVRAIGFIARAAGAVALGLASLAAAHAANAATRHVTKFDVRFAGLAVGTATFEIKFDGDRYELDLSGRTAGIADLFSPGSGEARSSGLIRGNAVQAERNEIVVVERRKDPARLEMRFTDGAVASLVVEPDKRKKKEGPEWVPIEPAQLSGVIDPVSSIVVPVAYEQARDPRAVCNRVIPIYDGDTRYDIALRYKATKRVETEGYNGWAYACQMRYVPVSGHRPGQKNVQYMANNKLMEIWLAPMAGTSVFSIIRVEVPTWLGRFVAEPQFFGIAAE